MSFLNFLDYSPANEFAIDKVPFKHVHVEDVKIERVCLNTVEFAVATNLRLPLVEVALCAGLAVELLNVVRTRVEQVAMIRLLI